MGRNKTFIITIIKSHSFSTHCLCQETVEPLFCGKMKRSNSFLHSFLLFCFSNSLEPFPPSCQLLNKESRYWLSKKSLESLNGVIANLHNFQSTCYNGYGNGVGKTKVRKKTLYVLILLVYIHNCGK